MVSKKGYLLIWKLFELFEFPNVSKAKLSMAATGIMEGGEKALRKLSIAYSGC